jgi:hypothetical protein
MKYRASIEHYARPFERTEEVNMKRLFSGLLVTAFLLTSSMLAASASSSSMKSTSSHSSMTTKKSCPAGETWVKGYKTKSGKTVKGYCRKK